MCTNVILFVIIMAQLYWTNQDPPVFTYVAKSKVHLQKLCLHMWMVLLWYMIWYYWTAVLYIHVMTELIKDVMYVSCHAHTHTCTYSIHPHNGIIVLYKFKCFAVCHGSIRAVKNLMCAKHTRKFLYARADIHVHSVLSYLLCTLLFLSNANHAIVLD